jgi:hypothetical protein
MSSLLMAIPSITSSEQDLGSLTWGAGVAPAGTITKKYKWNRVGNMVVGCFKVTATVAGTAVVSLTFDLPTDMPTPSVFASQPTGTSVVQGTGSIETSGVVTVAGAAQVSLLNNSGTYQVAVLSGAIAATNAWAQVTYITA